MNIEEKIYNIADGTIKWENVWEIPEFKKLQTTQQNPVWHSEGNVAEHTKRVVEAMYELCPISESDFVASTGEPALRYRKRYVMIMAALFHDIGKGETTKWDVEKEAWTSPNHAIVGERITRRILWDTNIYTREMICEIVRNHMKPLYLGVKNRVEDDIISLSLNNFTCVNDYLVMKTADCSGSVTQTYDGWREKIGTIRDIVKNKLDCLYGRYKFKNELQKEHFFENNPLCHTDTTLPYDFTVHILIGLPGSGKTTYRNANLGGYPVICRDEIRKEIGLEGEKPQGNKEQEEEVTRIQNERMKSYLEEHKTFVIDATNIQKNYRDEYGKKIRIYGGSIVFHYIEAPSYEQNLKRRDGMIKRHIIDNMRNRFDFPSIKECDKFIINKQGQIETIIEQETVEKK